MNILKEIKNKKRHKGAYGSQSCIDCPYCNEKIDYYWSSFAGVEWAKCRTKNCFDYKKSKLVLRKKPKLVKRKQLTLLQEGQIAMGLLLFYSFLSCCVWAIAFHIAKIIMGG